jgi:hypothetical protein
MEAINSIFKSIMPFLGIGAFAYVAYWIKLIMDKNRNTKKAENHVWIQIIPKTGNETNFMVPKESDNGVVSVKIPSLKGVIEKTSPTHILGEDGEFSAIWPPGKSKFVQIPVSKLTYYEGDAEPLSNVTDRPIISGQLLSNWGDGIATNTADALRKSFEDSAGGHTKKSSPFMWIYIILIVVGIIGVVNLIFGIQSAGVTEQVTNLGRLIQQALGLK